MTRCGLFLLLALTAGPAFSEWRESQSPVAPITIYGRIEGANASLTSSEMRAELASIMGRMGLEFEWRSLQDSHGNEASAELVVVTFKGSCQTDDWRELPGVAGALGWTHMSDGELLPFADVDCDRIRQFISPLLAGADADERRRMLGRAIARVLAHELYHILANTTKHGSGGIAKASHTASDLVREQFRFEEKESRLLRQGKLGSLIAGFPIDH